MNLRPLAATVAFALAASAHAEAPFSFATTPGKLPKDVVPVQYAAHLVPDLAARTFLGAETIEIDVLQPTRLIMLNAVNLEIDAASLAGARLPELKLTPLLDKEQQTLRFELADPLPAGRYRLSLKFHGKINREARGMFHMQYKNAAAQDKAMLATQMEPVDARRMLPAWDEPAFRAKFKLTVDVPEAFTAYSNTPVEKTSKLDGGLKRLQFGVTPSMPSYLLVLVAGELERVSAKQDGVDLGIVTTAGKLGSTAYALNASKDLLRYYNNYFGTPYPLPKLDQIAVPGGFSGAMENWGGIVYTESALLVDPQKSTEATKRGVFRITAHEIAHQWFGNLVTMAWWDNLWLNEGFASWMAAKATEQMHPEWRPWLAGAADRDSVMEKDMLATTNPIQTPVTTEAQAANAFNNITYVKGQAFLRMLEAYLGEDAFRRGMRTYMAKHQYSNTTSADLWAALAAASGKPVEKVAADWTTQPGLPLIDVAQSCDNGKRTVTLSQQNYSEGGKRQWHVPLQLGSVGGKSLTMLLEGERTSVTQPGCDGVLLVDPYAVGYFRVRYDKGGFDALLGQWSKLPDASRIKLLADSWSLAASGRGDLGNYMKLVARLGDEPRMAVWDSVIDNLNTLDGYLAGRPERAALHGFVNKLLAPRMKKLGWTDVPGESVEDTQLRYKLATAMARAGNEEAIAMAKVMFGNFLMTPASLKPSQMDFAMSVTGMHADTANYEALAGLLARTQNNEERRRYAQALASARNPALASRTLALALDTSLPGPVANRIVPAVAAAEHVDQAWTFALANREALLKNQDATGVQKMLPSLFATTSDVNHAAMLEKAVGAMGDADALAEAQQAAAGVRARARQKERLLPQLAEALK
jgi:aminopeptidase N